MQPCSSATDRTAPSPKPIFASHLLLAEFLHRSANDFAVACAEVHVAGRQPTLDEARDRLAIVADRLHALASIQRLLHPPKDGVIDLGNQLCELCHQHAQARFAEQGAFVRLRAGDLRIDAQRGWALLMLVSELLTNAARHAFDRPGGLVRVEAIERDGEIVCLVGDDGVGIDPGAARPRAGSAIIADLARDAGILLVTHPRRIGTMVELRLPIEAGA